MQEELLVLMMIFGVPAIAAFFVARFTRIQR